MNRDGEKLRIAIWVSSGLLAGTLIMAAVQGLYSNNQPNQIPESQAAEAPADAEAASEFSGQPHKTPRPHYLPEPNPVAKALAQLDCGQIEANDAMMINPGQSYAETVSGYPIYTGARAVDPLPVSRDESQLPPQVPGRNGLLGNPCADPPSSHSTAYSRSY